MAELAIGAHPGLSVAEETLSAAFLLVTWSEGTDGASRYLALYCLLSSVSRLLSELIL